MPAAAIPAIIGAAGSIGSAGLGYLASKKAGKLSPAEQQAQGQQQQASTDLSAAGKDLSQQGRTLTGYGMPQLQQGSRYFSTLAGGNRAAIGQTLAPETANINALYGGTQRTLNRFLRGADRDYQLGELARQRVGALGSLFGGARAQGVAGLVNLGQYGVSTGSSLQTAGAGALQGAAGVAGNLANQGAANRIAASDLQRQAGADVGGLVFQLLSGMRGRGPASTAPNLSRYGIPVTAGLPSVPLGSSVPINAPSAPAALPRTTSDRPYGGLRF